MFLEWLLAYHKCSIFITLTKGNSKHGNTVKGILKEEDEAQGGSKGAVIGKADWLMPST